MTARPAAADGGTPQVFPSVQVTTSPSPVRAFNQPQMLVDPKDSNTLVIAGSDYNSGDCRVWVSRDAGRTWTEGKGSARPPQYATCVRSDLGPFLGAAFTPDGALVVISAADNLGGQQQINNLYAARSTDLGDTWAFTTIHAGQTDAQFQTALGTTVSGGEHYSLVSAAADPTNPQYVYAGARYQIASRAKPYGLFGVVPLRSVVAASSDGGKTFSQPVDIMKGIPQSQIFGGFIPMISVGADGTVYAVTRDDPVPATATFTKSDGEGGKRYVSMSTDHGSTWKTVLLDDSSVPLISCDGGCRQLPTIHADPTNAKYVYAAYSQSPPSSPTSGQNVFLKVSSDSGKTWSSAVQLNDDRDNVDHLFPGVSVAPNGRIDVAWTDYRQSVILNGASSQKTERYWDIYYT
ncbi:MAG: sialidase family protein [Candidatus Dormibacteria bacterium]